MRFILPQMPHGSKKNSAAAAARAAPIDLLGTIYV
jgi:hypothetical protein